MWLLFISIITCVSISTPFVRAFYFLFRMHYNRSNNIQESAVKSIKTMLWVLYLILYQKIKHNVNLIGKGEYEIDYVLHEELYHFRVNYPRGPYNKNVLQVINEKDEDVTEEIRRYLGPYEDFHGHVYTPCRLGYKQLTFNLYNGNIVEYKEHEQIIVKNEMLNEKSKGE